VSQEVYIKIKEEKKELLRKKEELVNMKEIVDNIYQRCAKQKLRLCFDDDARQLYETFHASIVDYRKSDIFEESRLSVKKKSLGQNLPGREQCNWCQCR